MGGGYIFRGISRNESEGVGRIRKEWDYDGVRVSYMKLEVFKALIVNREPLNEIEQS